MLPLHKPNAPCPKCGAAGASTMWMVAIEGVCLEYLRRECRTCSYRWKERPLDQRTEAEQAEQNRATPIPPRWYASGD